MPHLITDKKKLVARMRRIRGQIESIERAIESDTECQQILETLASVRGALMGVMSALMESHLLNHVLDSNSKLADQHSRVAKEMVRIVKAFTK